MISDSAKLSRVRRTSAISAPLQSQGSLFNPSSSTARRERGRPAEPRGVAGGGRCRRATRRASARRRTSSSRRWGPARVVVEARACSGRHGSQARRPAVAVARSTPPRARAGRPSSPCRRRSTASRTSLDNPRLSQSELVAERHKRNRAMASLSSINSDLVDSALPSAEDPAAAVDSMELNFFTGPGEGGRPRASRRRRRRSRTRARWRLCRRSAPTT